MLLTRVFIETENRHFWVRTPKDAATAIQVEAMEEALEEEETAAAIQVEATEEI